MVAVLAPSYVDLRHFNFESINDNTIILNLIRLTLVPRTHQFQLQSSYHADSRNLAFLSATKF